MSFLRRAATRALLASPARQNLAFTPHSATRITFFSAAKVSAIRSLHQTRSVWAENDPETARETQIEEGTDPDADSAPTPLQESVPAPPSESSESPRVANTVYIGNFPFTTEKGELADYFSQVGEVVDVSLVNDRLGNAKGFGFVRFTRAEAVQAAIDTLNARQFQGRRLVVSMARDRARPSLPQGKSTTLFIGSLPREMSDRDLNHLFASVRNVVDVRVAIDRRTGQPRGFAHADFLDQASADRAKDELSAQVVHGRHLRVTYGDRAEHRRPPPFRSDRQEQGDRIE